MSGKTRKECLTERGRGNKGMSKGRNKYLFKNTVIFGIGNFATKFITFFLVPLYTYTLTTEEYGEADLVFAICSFLYPLITLNIAEAIFRFSMDKDENKDKIISNGVICFLGAVIVGAVISVPFFFMPEYCELVPLFYLYLITLSATQIILALLKGQEKLKLFTIGNIVNTVLIALCSVIFLLVMHTGIRGYFWAYIIGNVITTLFLVIFGKIFKGVKFSLDKKYFLKMTKYSVVLIPTSFMWWIMNSSDKAMISSFISTSANGIYAVSYKIPSLLTVIATIFNQAWVFSAVSGKDEKDNAAYTNRVFSTLLGTLCLVTVVISAVVKPLTKLLVAEEFVDAWTYTPILLFGFVFMTLATFISASYNAHKDSKGFLFSGSAGAIANILLNLALMPFLGVYGAAIATTLSYIAVFIYRIFDTKKYLKIIVNKRHILTFVVAMGACATTYIPNNIIAYPLFAIETLLVLLLVKNDIKNVFGIIRGKWRER